MMERTDVVVDGHIVVVEDNQQIVGVGRRIVEPFKGQSSGNGGIADYSNDLAVFFAFQTGCDRHTQRGRYRVGGMAGNESVVGTFHGRGESAQPAQFAVGRKTFSPPGEDFVSIGLMAYVPHDAIVGGVENVVQSDGEFYCPEARCKVARILGQGIDNELTQLVAQLGKLSEVEAAQVVGGVYVGEYGLFLGSHFGVINTQRYIFLLKVMHLLP